MYWPGSDQQSVLRRHAFFCYILLSCFICSHSCHSSATTLSLSDPGVPEIKRSRRVRTISHSTECQCYWSYLGIHGFSGQKSRGPIKTESLNDRTLSAFPSCQSPQFLPSKSSNTTMQASYGVLAVTATTTYTNSLLGCVPTTNRPRRALT